jgi:hypothetical protein
MKEAHKKTIKGIIIGDRPWLKDILPTF